MLTKIQVHNILEVFTSKGNNTAGFTALSDPLHNKRFV